jgi:hypothetical protein
VAFFSGDFARETWVHTLIQVPVVALVRRVMPVEEEEEVAEMFGI